MRLQLKPIQVYRRKFGIIGTKFGAGQNSTFTKVILQKIWGISGQNFEQADFHLYKGHIAENFGSSGQNLEHARIPLLQGSFYKKIGNLRTKSEQANLNQYKGHIAENLGSLGQFGAGQNFILKSSADFLIKQKLCLKSLILVFGHS